MGKQRNPMGYSDALAARTTIEEILDEESVQ
jgi:hypothetical protein